MQPIPSTSQPESKTLAVAALVAGICGFIPLLGLVFGLAAMVLGLVALSKHKTGQGLAIAGLATGAVGLILNIVVPVVAIPAVFSARQSAEKVVRASQQTTSAPVRASKFASRFASSPSSSAASRAPEETGQLRAADYCTIVLAPKLADELGLDAEQRVRLAAVRDTLTPHVNNALSMFVTRPTDRFLLRDNPASGEAAMMRSLDRSGEHVLEVLTPSQKAAFDDLRAAGKIAPVKARFKGPIEAAGPIPFEIRYTKYGVTASGEQPVRKTATRENGKPSDRDTTTRSESREKDNPLAQIKGAPEAVALLASTNAQVRNYSAQWLLKNAPVEPAHRAQVLAALKPHLTGAEKNDRSFFSAQQVYIEAFCRWADRDETRTLQEIARHSKDYRNSLAAALKALMRLDPAAAETVIDARLEELLFRASAVRTLEALDESDGVAQAEITRLVDKVRHYQKPAPGLARTTTHPTTTAKPAGTAQVLSGQDDAALLSDLQSGERHRLTPAMMKLMHTRPAAPNPAMAQALVAILQQNKSLPLRVSAARALENWGTAESLPALRKAADDPSPLIQTNAKKAIAKISETK